MRILRRSVPLVVGLAALLGLPPGVQAATVVAPSLSALVSRADRIIVSEVVEVRFDRDPGRGDGVPVTLVTVRAVRTLKGAGGSHLVLEFLGGRVDGDSLDVPDVPLFAVGDRDVLFLAGGVRRVSPLVGVMHGRFRLLEAEDAPRERVAAHDGRPLTLADLGEAAQGEPATPQLAAALRRPLSFAAFERAVLDLAARPVDEQHPPAAAARLARGPQPERQPAEPATGRLHVDINLGASPALRDGCPDWACALAATAWFRRLAAVAGRDPEPGAPAERVSLEWGRSVFGRMLDGDTLALTVRRTTGDASRTTVVFNEQLAWNAYGGAAAASAPAHGPFDLPAVAGLELTAIAARLASTAPSASGQPTAVSARGSSRGVPPSRTAPVAEALEVAGSACGPADVFVDPRLLTFTSPDHSMMTSYEVGFFQPGAPGPTQIVNVELTSFLTRRVVDLPSWAVASMQSSLVVDIRSAGLGTPIGVVHTYKVRGVWSGGTTAWSESSQPFVRCAVTTSAAR